LPQLPPTSTLLVGWQVNMIMMQGKKERARKHLWEALLRIRESGHDPQEVFYGGPRSRSNTASHPLPMTPTLLTPTCRVVERAVLQRSTMCGR
jgi:hypothetical protein